MNPPIDRVPRSHDRVVAGVASGWGERLGVDANVVRAAITVLTLAGGLGVALYAAAALWSTPPVSAQQAVAVRPRSTRRELAVGCGTAAALVAARSIGLWPGDQVMAAVTAVGVALAIVWSRSLTEQHLARPALVRLFQAVAGATLLMAGLYSLASRTGGLANVGASAGAIAVVVGGLAVFVAPALGRLLKSLDEERTSRIREDERAVVAAHLHDSVLQSLVLIQRSGDPRRMANLARRQERALRGWLYGASEPGDPTTLHAAVDAVIAEIESDHDVRVEAVVVGDQALDEPARALIAAVREAVVNAARHAGVDRVDVFVETDGTELTAFVRDTGRGFDATAVPADRHGISESIVARTQRAGGRATLTSAVDVGTEVEVRIPVRAGGRS